MTNKLFAGGFTSFPVGLSNTLQIPETYVIRKMLELKFPQWQNVFYMFCLFLLLGISLYFIQGKKAESWIEKNGCKTRGILMMAFLFVWAFISLSQVSTFLYFDF